MVLDVVLEKRDGEYVATVPAMPGLRTTGPSRDAVLAAVRVALARRLDEVEIVRLPMDGAVENPPYSPAQMELARKAARLRGEPDAPVTGKPWLDFAGLFSDVSDEEWAIFEAGVQAARDEADFPEPAP